MSNIWQNQRAKSFPKNISLIPEPVPGKMQGGWLSKDLQTHKSMPPLFSPMTMAMEMLTVNSSSNQRLAHPKVPNLIKQNIP